MGPKRFPRPEHALIRDAFLADLDRLGLPEPPGEFSPDLEGRAFSSFPTTITWSSSDEALWYVVRISGPGFTSEARVCGEQISYAQQFVNLIPKGQYAASVASANPRGQSEWLTASFTVGRE